MAKPVPLTHAQEQAQDRLFSAVAQDDWAAVDAVVQEFGEQPSFHAVLGDALEAAIEVRHEACAVRIWQDYANRLTMGESTIIQIAAMRALPNLLRAMISHSHCPPNQWGMSIEQALGSSRPTRDEAVEVLWNEGLMKRFLNPARTWLAMVMAENATWASRLEKVWPLEEHLDDIFKEFGENIQPSDWRTLDNMARENAMTLAVAARVLLACPEDNRIEMLPFIWGRAQAAETASLLRNGAECAESTPRPRL